MKSLDDILSRQCAEIHFKGGRVEYFSLSTQWDEANTLEEALTNIVEADIKYDGKTPLAYAMRAFALKED